MVGRRLNKKVSSVERVARRLGPYFDSKFDQGGFLALDMPTKKRLRTDPGLTPKARPVSVTRANTRRENSKKDVSVWQGSSYCMLDNSAYGYANDVTSENGQQLKVFDYQYPDIVICADDTSSIGKNMWSMPIGLRVMQQHYGAFAGCSVGAHANYLARARATSGAGTVSGATVDAAWTQGVALPSYTGVPLTDNLPLTADVRRMQGSINTGSMFYNHIGIQWNPLGVNFLDDNDWNKLANFKYFRFLKFGMKITPQGPSYRSACKKQSSTVFQYPYAPLTADAIDLKPTFGSASTDHRMYDYIKTFQSSGAPVTNVVRAGPARAQSQPYGLLEYMIVGPERLYNLNLPGLMGYDQSGTATGLGCVHVWDTLKELGIKVHTYKGGSIDLTWKPYSYLLDSAGNIDQTQAGPLSPVVEIDKVSRLSNSSITPYFIHNGDATALSQLKALPYVNGYPYAHIGPAVLMRFAGDPGVSCHLVSKSGWGEGVSSTVNTLAATVPFTVKCWSKYHAWGEDFDTFDMVTTNMFPQSVLPTAQPFETERPNTIDPTNAG